MKFEKDANVRKKLFSSIAFKNLVPLVFSSMAAIILCVALCGSGSAEQAAQDQEQHCELILDHFNVTTTPFQDYENRTFFEVPASQSHFEGKDRFDFEGGFASAEVSIDVDFPAVVPVRESNDFYINWTARGKGTLDSHGLGLGRSGRFHLGGVEEGSPGGNGTENKMVTFSNVTRGTIHEKGFYCEWLDDGMIIPRGSLEIGASFDDQIADVKIEVKVYYKLVKHAGPVEGINTSGEMIIVGASKPGYSSQQKDVENSENLGRIEISGRVTDRSTAAPIEGASVEIVSGAEAASATTAADGTYTIAAVVSGGAGSGAANRTFDLIFSEYIVGVKEINSDVIDLIEKNNGTIVEKADYRDGPKALLVYISREEDIEGFLENVRSSPLVKYVELNELVYADYVPNDPGYPLQWGPRNIMAGGLPNPSAWNIERGDNNISIAIVDTGIQYNHRDLAKFKDGKEKYKYGHDWVDLDDDPSPLSAIEDHGTHCTGIATATMDNSIGIAGIAPNCTFMAERAMQMVFDWPSGSWRGAGTFWDISRGIMDAADHDADIISMSLGSRNSSELIRDATLYASNLGSILVAASGNDANENWYQGGINYPAAHPWVISAGATDRNSLRANFSQWGTELDLVAPGVDIYSAVPFDAYDNMSGTSMATPHVAGVAALVKSRAERWPSEPYASNPRYHLNNDQIVKVLIQSAVDLGPSGWDQEYGYGKVDAARAIRCVNISGTVLEAVLNAPIAGVEVRATSIEGPPGVYSTNENSSLARINPDGSYFLQVPPGIYQICAMAFGYMPTCGLNGDRAELPAFDINGNLYRDNRDFRLVPFPCNVTGRVNDSSTGEPVEGAKIYADGPPSPYPPHPDIRYETQTDPSGGYYFLLEYGVDPNGVYNVTAIKEGYQNQVQSFELNWSNVVTNYYTCRNCRLDGNDFNPISVNLSLDPGRAELGAAGLSHIRDKV